jgi:hypothetical protein
VGTEAGIMSNNPDLPMNYVNLQADTDTQGDSVRSKRNCDGTVANTISQDGTQTSVTHMDIDGIPEPNMGESA